MVERVESREGRLVVNLKDASESAPLVGLLVQARAEIEGMKKLNASLEEAFLTLLRDEER